MGDVVSDLATRRVVDPERIAAHLARVVAGADRRRARRGLPAAQVLLTAPGFEYSSGERARRYHAASVGKMMTATRLFQLVERRRLDIDAPLTALLPDADRRGLFVRDGLDAASAVTPRHLLTHTSGAADYFGGAVVEGPTFERLLIAEPDRRWTPADLLAFSRERQRPVAAPGARFSYSDTGYVLLGRIIEEAGDAPLGAQLHAGVLEPAGMAESCLLFHTRPGGAGETDAAPAAALDIAPLWIGRHELSRDRALSCDWGGGGVVTTLDDVTRFLGAWADGALLSEHSRAAMRAADHRFRPGVRYGAGLMQLRYSGFSPLLAGMPRADGHLGVTAAHAFTIPGSGIRLAMNFHSTREMVASFRVHIELVRRVLRALAD